MKIELKCFASLVNPGTCDYQGSTTYELAESQTVEDLVQAAGVDKENLTIAFVNGRVVCPLMIVSPAERGPRIYPRVRRICTRCIALNTWLPRP